MSGAINDYVTGSVFEGRRNKGGDWNIQLFAPESRFTDGSVMPVTSADKLEDISHGKEFCLAVFRA